MKLVTDANKTIERTIREIKEAEAEKERTKSARSGLTELKKRLEEEVSPISFEQPLKAGEPGAKSPVVKKPASPSPSNAEMFVPLSPKNRQYQSYLDDMHRKLQDFEMTLDLRGKRVEECISILQRYIDDAIMLSIPEVRILHGKGNGVLRQVTRDYLRSVKEIKSAKDELIERGGSGITVVLLR